MQRVSIEVLCVLPPPQPIGSPIIKKNSTERKFKVNILTRTVVPMQIGVTGFRSNVEMNCA